MMNIHAARRSRRLDRSGQCSLRSVATTSTGASRPRGAGPGVRAAALLAVALACVASVRAPAWDSSLPGPVQPHPAALDQPAAPRGFDSPLRPVGQARDGMVRLELDPASYARLGSIGVGASFSLRAVPLSPTVTLDLDVERFDVLTPDAQLVAMDATGPRALDRPELVLLRGTVAGKPDSTVFLALSPHGSNGIIEFDASSRFVVSSGTDEGKPSGSGSAVAYNLSEQAPGRITLRPPNCGGGMFPPGVQPVHSDAHTSERGAAACRTVRVAVDSDNEYLDGLFGGSDAPGITYAITLLAATSEIYRRELSVSLQLPFVRVWTSPDPYPTRDIDSVLLDIFRSVFRQTADSIPRSLEHLLSGKRNGFGGIAYLNVLCTASSSGISGYLDGFFPRPLVMNSPQNWDPVVVAHEIGHNFGARHTHDLSPPADGCGNGDCSAAWQGTIMSYCQTCVGGISNVALRFHERNKNENIFPYINGSAAFCLRECSLDSRVVNMDARFECSAQGSAAQIVLDAGRWALVPVSPENSPVPGVFYAWSPYGNVWYTQYVIETDSQQGVLVGGSGILRSSPQAAFADHPATPLIFTLTRRGWVRLLVGDSNCSDNRGGISVLPTRCPDVTSQPVSRISCAVGSVSMTIAHSQADGPLTYRWTRGGLPVSDVPGRIGGSTTPTITFTRPASTDAGTYLCEIINGCGTTTTASAFLTVCRTEFSCDGVRSPADIFAFLSIYFAGDAAADFDGNGLRQPSDIFAFLGAYFAGC
jgi:hypothetical protein